MGVDVRARPLPLGSARDALPLHGAVVSRSPYPTPGRAPVTTTRDATTDPESHDGSATAGTRDAGTVRGAPPVRRLAIIPLPGAWGALLLFCVSYTPSLLPRGWLFQGAVSGISALLGYGIGVLAAAVWRAFADRERRPARRGAWWTFGIVAVVATVVFFVLGRQWQTQLTALMSTPQESLGAALLGPVAALVVFALLVAVCKVVRLLGRGLGRLLARWTGPRGARALGGLLVGVLVLYLVSGVALDGFVAAADRSFAAANDATPDGVTQPTSPQRSAGPGSLISWDSLGREGRIFVAGGPSAAEIGAFTGAPAPEPIRIYAGVASADGAEARARLAVDDLVRAGGFERSRLLVATTTGQGWLDAGAMSSFEYVAGGDSAIVSQQYSYVPSGISYIVDGSRARAAGRAMFDAVYEHWLTLPADARPQLFVFGESLGSFGGESAFSGEADLRNRTSGALFVGPPNFNALHTEFRDDRDPGSPEVEPVYRGGRTVRFATDIDAGAPPVGVAWNGPRTLILQHPSDPITWWSPRLLFERPDWLAEPRGRDVLGSMTWIPLVTFWQITLDMPHAAAVPEGHGHRYTRESVDGWATLLQPAGWTGEKADRLRAIVAG